MNHVAMTTINLRKGIGRRQGNEPVISCSLDYESNLVPLSHAGSLDYETNTVPLSHAGPLDYESNTVPLSHAGPLIVWRSTPFFSTFFQLYR